MEHSQAEFSCETYILKVQEALLDAYMEPQHFSDALTIVAEHMSAELAFLWLPKRDNELKSWYLTTAPHPFLEDMNFRIKYSDIYEEMIQNTGISVSGKEQLLQRFPSSYRQLIQCSLTSLALYPVYWPSGKIAFLIGAINYAHEESALQSLKQVSLSFFMAFNHFDNYHILDKMGRIDTMTGLLNRNSYHIAIAALKRDCPQSIACIYIDANGLHEINNYLGHPAGDDMLRTVSNVISKYFKEDDRFRIGGDEFLVLCQNCDEPTLCHKMEQVRSELLKSHYEISYGIEWSDGQYQIDDLINAAEDKMRLDKQNYYNKAGKTRNLNLINKQMERLLNEKRDADLFLAVLRPEFKGVYFVDLDTDTVRHIFIPNYFEEILAEVGDIFSDAMLEYAQRYVPGPYLKDFEQVCNYDLLREMLDRNELPGFLYQKKNGEFLRLNIVKLQSDTEQQYRTLWTFSDPDMIKI